jgi:hypothetical protein
MSGKSLYPMNTTTAFPQPFLINGIYQLPEAPTRLGLTITNLGPGVVNMTSGGEASATFGYPIAVNQTLSFQNPESCPKSYLSFFAVAVTTLAFIVTTEGQQNV